MGDIYYEDCLSPQDKFPEIHIQFVKRHFIVNFTNRKGRYVPMDETLEKSYNKPPKGKAGIIGLKRRNETVAQDVITLLTIYTSYVRYSTMSEYDLHQIPPPPPPTLCKRERR